MSSSDSGFILNISSQPSYSKKVLSRDKTQPFSQVGKNSYNKHIRKKTEPLVYKRTFSEYDSGLDNLKEFVDLSQNSPQKINHIKKKKNHFDNKEIANFQAKKIVGHKTNQSNVKQSNIHDGKKIVYSSIFNSNPEVPNIPISSSAGKKGKKESLFSNQTFSDLNLHPHLVSCLQSRFNVSKVTEVQKLTIPVILGKKDALVKSCTGSGKTLSYAVPIVQMLQELRPKIQRSQGVFALVILPTRELALQSYECFSKLTKAFTWIVPGYLIGGEKKKSEKARIRKGINILVSTPGRLLDHQEHTANLQFHTIKWLIVDEADKLLEAGFGDAVLRIISFCPSMYSRQTVLLSATLTKEVEKLAGMSLNNPEYIDTASESATMEDLVIPAQLKQYIVMVPTKLRLVTLSAFIVEKCVHGSFKALIFMSTQNAVDFHFILFNHLLKTMVKSNGCHIKFFKLHGSMKQEDRTAIFNQFKPTQNGILLCTDVAARGLDLPHVDWIIQYNAPESAENYVHRVGRTARIGQKGHSLIFLLPSEIKFVELLRDRNIFVEELYYSNILNSLLLITDAMKESSSKAQSFKNPEECAARLQFCYEDLVYSDTTLYDSAKDGFLTSVQAYATYPREMRSVFPFKLLHLGHVAKSFCLRESPSELGCKFAKQFKKKQVHKQNNSRSPQKRKIPEVSEYDSGLNFEHNPKKKKKTF